MDLRWLSAPADEVAEAMLRYRLSSRPSWVPTKRRVLVHLNHCLMIWYLFVVLMVLGVRIDTLQSNRINAIDVRDMVICGAIFALWVVGAVCLYRWSKQPPSSQAKVREARQVLTALANGFESSPCRGASFAALITGEEHLRSYPRFVADGIEFGNLGYRTNARSGTWHYLAVQLPAPVPHMLLDSAASRGFAKLMPVQLRAHQDLSLEGDFDRWFRAYAPGGYGRDARYLLTPDVMDALVDCAHAFSVEMRDSRVVFCAPEAADFSHEEPWIKIEQLVDEVVETLARNASRYRDHRIEEQNVSPTMESIRVAIESPGERWIEPTPRIARDGTRLRLIDRRTGLWLAFGAVGWVATLAFLYAVPTIFAFAGFMSIADGR